MVLLGLTLLATDASARSAPQSTNTSADQAAMTAYRTYLSALIAAAPTAAARAGQVVSGADSSCPGALSDLTKLSSSQLQNSALTAFGHEIDADLAIAYAGAGTAALNRFAQTLGGLTWSTQAQSSTPLHLIASERALAGLTPSDLCADATSLDGAPLSEPTTTKRFLARYSAVTQALETNLSSFKVLLAKFETAGERKLVAQINSLVAQYATLSETTEQTDATALLSDLGVSANS